MCYIIRYLLHYVTVTVIPSYYKVGNDREEIEK